MEVGKLCPPGGYQVLLVGKERGQETTEKWLLNARPNGELKAKEHGLKNTHHAFV